MPNVQIESYPGAKFHHISKFKKHNIEPEHVILSVGINNRNQNVRNTAIPNLKVLLAKAERAFPNSKLYIAQINYSMDLPQVECCCLSVINDFLATYSGYTTVLPQIDRNLLQVKPDDPVHYTSKSANAILSHWMEHLN